MAGDQRRDISTAKTATLQQIMKFRMDDQRQRRKEREYHGSSRDEYNKTGFYQLERNQKHVVVSNETPQQRRYERDKWSSERNIPMETKLYHSKSVQKHDSMRARLTNATGSSRKITSCFSKEKAASKPAMEVKHSWFSNEDIKELSQLFKDVEKQLKQTTPPTLEASHKEAFIAVSEIKVAEPESAILIQEIQTKSSMEKEKSETEQECSLFFPQSELDSKNTFDELTFLEPVQPSSLVSVSQVAEEDLVGKEPEHSTQGKELEQQNISEANTNLESYLSYDLQEHCKEFNMGCYAPEMFVKVSTEDIKRFDLDKVKDFCVSKSVFDNIFKSFKELKPENLFDHKRFQTDNNNILGHVLSLDQFLKHNISFDHYEKVLELKLKQCDGCFRKPCESLARTEERSFVMNFPRHKQVTDNFLASTYVLKEPRKLHKTTLHHSDVRIEIVKSTNISEFELNCLCAGYDSRHAGLFFSDILVYNTFFDKHVALLKLEIIGSGCIVLCHVNILVYNTFFDMMKHLTCPKEAEKVAGEKRGYNDQSINDESLAKWEMQQANLESCLAVSLDIGAFRGSYRNNQRELSRKIDCHGNLTQQSLTSNWNHVQSFSGERVMGSTSWVILCLFCLNFEFSTTQSYLWRPGDQAMVSNHVLNSYFIIDYTDMMHLFLSKEPCADYEEALKHTRRKKKHEEDKRFKPPNLNQERYQDVTCFILIKETPPDAANKPKPSKNQFGIRLVLFDKFSCANLFCFNVSGLRNESGNKWIIVFYISESINNNSCQRGLQDLRTNLFQEGGNDMILDQLANEDSVIMDQPANEDALAIPGGLMTCSRTKKLNEAHGRILRTAMKQEESLGRSLIIQDTLLTIQAISPTS